MSRSPKSPKRSQVPTKTSPRDAQRDALLCELALGLLLAVCHILFWNHIQEAVSTLAILVKRPVEPIGSIRTARCASRGTSIPPNPNSHGRKCPKHHKNYIIWILECLGLVHDVYRIPPALLEHRSSTTVSTIATEPKKGE